LLIKLKEKSAKTEIQQGTSKKDYLQEENFRVSPSLGQLNL